MQSFVLAGKARVVFRIVELMAKGEKTEKADRKGYQK